MSINPKIYLGSDHAGFMLKEAVKQYLLEYGLKVVDQGNDNFQSEDDYPFFSHKVASQVALSKNARGLLFCGNAQGVCIAANKVAGVRAALGYSPYGAETSRLDDNSNVLCLAGRVLTAKQAKEIVTVWLETEFSNEVRHKRRLDQVREIEDKKWRSIEIIPTILEKNFAGFQRKVRKVEKYFPLAQIDVADGSFVPSIDFSDWKQIRKIKTDLNYDLHLMHQRPDEYLKQFNSFGKVVRVFFHLESQVKAKQIIASLKRKNVRVGVAINPETSARKIKGLLKLLDAVLIMAVKPGHNGSQFIEPYDKIKQIRKWAPDLTIVIDGGVSPKNSLKLIKAGATALAVGNFLNKSKNWERAIRRLRGIKK